MKRVYTPETRQGKALNRSVGEQHSFLGYEIVGTLKGGELKYIGIFYYDVERK